MNPMSTDNAYVHIVPYLKNKLVFDIGAAVGEVTKRLTDLQCQVVSVEPQEHRTKNNPNFDKCLSVINKCVSSSSGTIEFEQCISQPNLSSCAKYWKVRSARGAGSHKWKNVILPSVTLDELISEYGIPSFIKIDIEGYEYEALKGLSNSVDYIYMECTGGFRKYFDLSMCELNRLGYFKYVIYASFKKKINGKKIKYFNVFNVNGAKELINRYSKLKKWVQWDLLVVK